MSMSWSGTARGLATIFVALFFQVGFTCSVLLLPAFRVDERRLPNWIGVIAALAALGNLSQLLMAVGMFRFARQPAPAPGAGLARCAGILAFVGLAVSAYWTTQLFRLAVHDPGSSRSLDMRGMAALEFTVTVGNAILNTIAWLAMLTAIAAVARHLQFDRVRARAVRARWLLVVGAMLPVLAVAVPATPALLVVLLGAVVGLMLAFLVFGSVGGLALALRHA